jgi:hypothetical protein
MTRLADQLRCFSLLAHEQLETIAIVSAQLQSGPILQQNRVLTVEEWVQRFHPDRC